jgi:hypothetical protein
MVLLDAPRIHRCGTGVAVTSQRFSLLSQPRVDDVVLSQPLAESSGLVATDHHVLSVLSAAKNQPKHDILSLHDLHRDNVLNIIYRVVDRRVDNVLAADKMSSLPAASRYACVSKGYRVVGEGQKGHAVQPGYRVGQARRLDEQVHQLRAKGVGIGLQCRPYTNVPADERR